MPANCSLLSSSTGKRQSYRLFAHVFLAATVLAVVLSAEPPQSGGETEAALKRQAIENPSDFEANNRLGEFYVSHGKYAVAVPYLGAAYRLNSSDYNNAFDLAQAELQAGNTAGARNLTTELLSKHDRPELHRLLGDCEEAAGNFREAANQYQIAARADPSEPNLFSFASELLKYRGYHQAEQVLSFAVARYPKSARLRVALGIAQYSLGRYRDAVETLCSAVDLNSADTRAFEFLGKMTGVAPELSKEVSARLKHFVTAYPDNAAANYYYAMSLMADSTVDGTNKFELARQFLERAVAKSPKFADAHYQLGIIYQRQHDTKRAIAEFETTVRLEPQRVDAHYRLAQLYKSEGKTALAAREYDAVKNLRGR